MPTPLPDYLVPRPAMPADAETLAAFDRLFDEAVQTGGEIDYRLAASRWQFACHIADTRPVVLHGSGDGGIALFEPRQPQDATEFGNQRAVFAASDGLWPMYFAILDREGHRISLINASVRPIEADGSPSTPHYFFSISAPALAARAFRPGTLYFLPRETFRQQPEFAVGPHRVRIDQWASLEPVAPLCRLRVTPEDFPLLSAMRGHDDEATFARIQADPEGFPWVDEGNR